MQRSVRVCDPALLVCFAAEFPRILVAHQMVVVPLALAIPFFLLQEQSLDSWTRAIE